VSVRAGVHWFFHFGKLPVRAELYRYAALSVPLILVSAAGIYVVYPPLSYIVPGFVTEWLLIVPPSLDWDEPQAHGVVIGGSIILLCVIAPVTEEITFRGFHLNRWWKKYGLWKAIASSSICFAILHGDVIGGLIFAFDGEIEDGSWDEFRSFWWLGALGLIIGTPWLFWFWNRYLRGEARVPRTRRATFSYPPRLAAL
jgi:membrane protease YdiL (CAAX protease family)